MGNAQATADALPSSWYDQADDATKKKASSRLSTRSKPADTMDRSPVQKSMSSMDGRKKRASGDLYDEYLTHPIPKEDGSAEVSATLDRVALKRMLSEVSDEHFDVLWRLFDASGSGLVKKDQFVVAMALLTSDSAETYDEQLEAVFFMFDTTRSGVLKSEDFEGMVRAMVHLKLGSLLQEDAFVGEFKKYLEKELSSENLDFWQAVKEYEELKGDDARLTRALEINAKYVEDGSPEQVNLPSDLVKVVTKQLADKQAPQDLFKRASDDIFKLMEKDTLSRFRSDPQAIEKLLDSFYKAVNLAPGKPVTFAKFKQWALREPTVLGLFTGISASIRELLEDRASKLPPEATVDAAVDLTPAMPTAKASPPASPQKMGFFSALRRQRTPPRVKSPPPNVPQSKTQTV